MDDAHAHDAAHQRRARCEERDLRGGNPQSQARVEHQNDEHGDEQIADLLRNAQLSGQRVILLEEQIVLDPLRTLMQVILLRKPRLVVGNLFAGTTGRRGLHDEGHDQTADAVDEQHKAEEHVQTAGHGLKTPEEGVVNIKAGENQQNHGNKVNPVRDHERHRMSFTIVCQMRHVTSPPKGS